ncbi:MAG: DMT family transporter [Pirellulaceae bacterium]|nr:DMT family transporter [Pirellulaceae bacterium]
MDDNLITEQRAYATSIQPNHGSFSFELLGLLFILANAWALQYAFAKLSGETELPAFGSLLLVHLIICLLLGTVLLGRRQMFVPTFAQFRFFLCVALLGNIVPEWAELTSAQHISAGMLTLVVSTTPVFILILTMLFRTERVTTNHLCALSVGGTAALCLLWPKAEAGSTLGWLLMAFLAPMAFATMAVLLRAAWPKGLSSAQLVFGCIASGLGVLFPLAFLEGEMSEVLTAPIQKLGPIFGYALMLLAEYWVFAAITSLGGAVYTSSADFAAVALGLFWAFLLFNERPTMWMWIAAGLALGTILIMRRGEGVAHATDH